MVGKQHPEGAWNTNSSNPSFPACLEGSPVLVPQTPSELGLLLLPSWNGLFLWEGTHSDHPGLTRVQVCCQGHCPNFGHLSLRKDLLPSLPWGLCGTGSAGKLEQPSCPGHLSFWSFGKPLGAAAMELWPWGHICSTRVSAGWGRAPGWNIPSLGMRKARSWHSRGVFVARGCPQLLALLSRALLPSPEQPGADLHHLRGWAERVPGERHWEPADLHHPHHGGSTGGCPAALSLALSLLCPL